MAIQALPRWWGLAHFALFAQQHRSEQNVPVPLSPLA